MSFRIPDKIVTKNIYCSGKSVVNGNSVINGSLSFKDDIIEIGNDVDAGTVHGTIAIGGNAMSDKLSISIGNCASATGMESIAIGNCTTTSGAYSIAVGNDASTDATNTIVINALTTGVSGTDSGALYIAPIRAESGSGALEYNTTTAEITYNSAKTFVIAHPIYQHKYLVHACLEGPESGVYYRGMGEITDNHSTVIYLPNYADTLATNFTVQITPVYNGSIRTLNTSDVISGSFEVFGESGAFSWLVHGKRGDIQVEPVIQDNKIKGDGPYTWL